MDENNVNILTKVDYYVQLVLKRRWLIILPFCLSMCVGIYLALTLPEKYSASNLILVVPKSVPDKYVPTLQASDTGQRINTIKQQIMSRTNLEKIIERFNLYSEPKYRNWFVEDKIGHMRRNTAVKVTKSGQGIESFRIVFAGKNPKIVMGIANRLAETFIDESVKIIQIEVMETNKFLQDELDELRGRLEKIEIAIQKYRKQNMGNLPEELSSNLKMIESLQLQLSEKQQDLRDAKNRLVELENRFSAINLSEESDPLLVQVSSPSALPPDKEPSDLEKLQATLASLQLRYTDRHPDIIRLKSIIENLEAAQKEMLPENIKTESGETPEAERPDAEETQIANRKKKKTSLFDKARFDIATQREATFREINMYNADIAKIEKMMSEYQKRVEKTPKTEHSLMAKQRDYENLQRTYKNLLDRKLESDFAVNMEKKQKGQKFQVIDTARLPQKPISPNIMMIFAGCLVVGLGVGGASFF
ncbi:hypothetical protein DENIS_0169 [Desulfonema ishimotonii]|uniref:Lipopolysaccharide biosynthesis protein n=1 Tax=Desulfonema ishimotonii TaxID=45657 RepID=A0A401FQH2_9BACT|nr:GNVR domain-containing protein [Desulfonema ishimotonii]GBC59233.1 hypothetical protein DENIS_0169 [Desulfonema ishimotonii]